MLESLDAPALRRWCAGALAALRRHQGEIDELNVYPVPDGDTGTNLVLTLTSANEALTFDTTAADGDATPVLRLMARGALLGARGNSGVIISQILRGLADATSALPSVDGPGLARGLRAGAEAAYGAVANPVEGTVLTVAAAAATAAEEACDRASARADQSRPPSSAAGPAAPSGTGAAGGSASLGEVAKAAAGAAAEALARTPEQLPALARAGVVDAGGRGLCVLLDALVEVVTGDLPAEPRPTPFRQRATRPLVAARESGSTDFDYEVQFLLDAAEPAVEKLRARLAELGDSLVVVGTGEGDDSTWNVHVHVNDVGAALEAGVEAGRPHRIAVTRFDDQLAADGPDRAVVVVAAGEGIADLFAAEGAAVVAANPSTGELLAAVTATGAAHVVVLPNDPNTQIVATAAAREATAAVRVVPTRSPVQALAALAVRDPARAFDDDVIAMAEAAGACRYAEVCYASRDALTVAGPCRRGDVLALVEGEVHLIGADLTATCRDLLDRLLGGGGELVTLLTGEDAPPGLTDALRAHVAARWPFVEVHTYAGGHPHYPLLVGVE
ncbi:DAK2 domain-containing protein [Asanoa sp. WMMD1127]|uniref:DAK2 domain-containing protein n=1 Tax=Asanoa sp. WMMD1127 TaxID=3016107 RepID=UPI002416F437|nr:DAK2 domain-containing protein [Asanoa sp. WMMD1127]MDG4823526.1 DAK2 domain-containing protein [Asanoa sp. WMMD1127]